MKNILAVESKQVKNIVHEPFTCTCSSPPLQNHHRYIHGISEKKNSNSKLPSTYIFKSVFALHSLYTRLVSSIGRLLRLKKQIASTNKAFITYSCDDITQIQDVQEVIIVKLT